MEKEVDKTIEDICKWIQKELKNDEMIGEGIRVQNMTKALAELVSARAGLNYEA